MPEINCRYMEDPLRPGPDARSHQKSFDFMDHEAFRDIVDEVITPTRDQVISDDALDAWIMASVDIGQHLSGTCKMGTCQRPDGGGRPVRQGSRYRQPPRRRRLPSCLT